MIKSKIDYSIYVVSDSLLSRGRPITEVMSGAIDGGATLIQYREKRGLSTRSIIDEVHSLKEVTQKNDVPLIINDRMDIALVTGADGIHLGQEDIPVSLARSYLGEEKIIGVTVHSVKETLQAMEDGADYAAVSSVFATSTKLDTGLPVGLNGVQQIATVSEIPVIAIGGINAENAGSVIQSGADGIAVVSAVVSARDPAAAVRSIKLAIARARHS